jgi:hypothetical protein
MTDKFTFNKSITIHSIPGLEKQSSLKFYRKGERKL